MRKVFVWQVLTSLAAAVVLGPNFPCEFTLGRSRYDLCPLIASRTAALQVEILEDTPPTRNRLEYTFGFKEPLKGDPTLPSALQCPNETWICLKVINTRPDHPSEPDRILQVVPVAGGLDMKPTARIGSLSGLNDSSSMLLHFHGGMYGRKPQKAAIEMVCDPQAPHPSFLSLAWSWNGTHAFSWRTRHACPKNTISDPRLPEPGSGNDRVERPPPDTESSDRDITPRSSFFFIFTAVFLCFLLIRYKFSLRSFAGLPYTVSGILHGNPGTGRGTYFARRTPRYLDSGGIYVDEDEELSDSYEFTIGAAASDQELEGMPLSPKSRNAFRTAKGLARPALYGSLASPGAKL